MMYYPVVATAPPRSSLFRIDNLISSLTKKLEVISTNLLNVTTSSTINVSASICLYVHLYVRLSHFSKTEYLDSLLHHLSSPGLPCKLIFLHLCLNFLCSSEFSFSLLISNSILLQAHLFLSFSPFLVYSITIYSTAYARNQEIIFPSLYSSLPISSQSQSPITANSFLITLMSIYVFSFMELVF